jgi:hypothetical protein
MPKRKLRSKEAFFKPVHLQAVVFLLMYSVISKSIFIKSISSVDNMVAFLVPYVFGVVAGFLFLYLFSHEDFFHFARDVEKMESKREYGLLKKYKHYGKVVCTLIIATLGGPVFSALTIRLLLNNYKHKFLILAIGNIPSTLTHVVVARGAFFAIF